MQKCQKCKCSFLALKVVGIGYNPTTNICNKCDPDLPWSNEHQLIDISDEIREYLNESRTFS